MQSKVLEHQVRSFLYLSTLSAARTQYLYDKISWSDSSIRVWQKLIKAKQNMKNVYVPHQVESLPEWLIWPDSVPMDTWREFLSRSSRLSVEALVCAFVLNYEDSQISEIFELTEGGVTIALAEGLLRLGDMLPASPEDVFWSKPSDKLKKLESETPVNQAVVEPLILLALRQRLTQAEFARLSARLQVSESDAEKAKKMSRALKFISKLEEFELAPSHLPQAVPTALIHPKILLAFSQLRVWAPAVAVILGLGVFQFVYMMKLRGAQDYLVSMPHSSQAQATGNLQEVTSFFDSMLALDPSADYLLEEEAIDEDPSLILAANDIPDEQEPSASREPAEKSPSKPKAQASERTTNQAATTQASAARTINSVETGFVIRGILEVDTIAGMKDVLEISLSPLGARKAGQVELGWEKAPDILYYHFTTASEFEESVKQAFGTLGRLRWSRVSHPRKMPNGVSRYIVEVQEK